MTQLNGANITNLSGTWVMDKKLSTNLDSVLKLQGISWIMRKAISASTTTLKITQGSDEAGNSTECETTGWMVLQSTLSGGLEGTAEKRKLNWTKFAHNDTLFGRVTIRSHYVPGQTIADGRMRPLLEPFTKAVVKPDAESILTEAVLMPPEIADVDKVDKAFIHDSIYSDYDGWTAEQVWAAEIIGEEQFLTRRIVVWKGSYAETARVFYRLA